MKLFNVKASVELQQGESVVAVVNPSKWIYTVGYISGFIGGLFGLLFIIAGLATIDNGGYYFASAGAAIAFISFMPFIAEFVYRNTTEFTITNKRVIVKSGWLSISMDEIKREKVESVNVHQTMFNRIFSIGSIIVSGSGGHRVSARGIPEPRSVRNLISE